MIDGLRRIGLGMTLFAFTCAGCSSASMVKIKGRLLKNGEPMIVSQDTYVTLSFIPDSKQEDGSNAKSYSAAFNQNSGTYSVDLPAGKYRTMLVIAPPSKKQGKLSMPSAPIKSDQVYELTKNQDLDIVVPGK